ncbi:integrin alpha-6-like [Anableps anableps]
MAKHWYMVSLWIVWNLQIFNVAAFNLDTQNVLIKQGDPGSLFGFSVAFHQQLSPARRNLLLVGAPRAKHQNQENVTGVVYSCDLSSTSDRCQPIEFNNKEFLNSKGINNQWMGVKVTSQGPGKNVMACSHRYQEGSLSHYAPNVLTGQCYILGDDLQVGEEERRWRRVVCDLKHLTTRQKNHDWFAYCQQGHGASFAKDNTSLLIGAPGAYQWKGIVRMEQLDDLDFDSEEPRETGDFDQFNHKLIPLQRNSYLGFSVDSGMALIKQGELTVVSGAPRGGYSGQVAFLKPDPLTRSNLSVELVLSGPALASSFGYDVAVVDLNNDGWEDLAVGAPEFFVKDSTIGGAVFIFINTKGKDWEKIVPIQLHENTESMFGLAVENIGDINQDGYGDIAVGAPYDDSGRVYVFCGSPDGINRKPAQVLSPGLKTVSLFGYSLSGNLDVDNNQFPDLAVGSLSDHVFVFRKGPDPELSSRVLPKENWSCLHNKEKSKDIVDKLRSIPVSVTMSLWNSTEKTSVGSDQSNMNPVLNIYQQNTTVTEITLINQGCGSDNICQSNLQLHYKFCSKKTQNDQNIFKSLVRDEGVAVITPSDEEIALEITVSNKNGDDAHRCHSVIMLPDTMRYSSVLFSGAEEDVSCTANDSGTLIDCDLGNPLQRDAEVTFYIMLTTSGISLNTTVVNVTLQLQTTSVQMIQPVEALAKVFFELELQVYGLLRPSQVTIGDIMKGESAIKSADEIGPAIQYEFRITNLGRPLKSFANASLNINWPKENSVGKWLLYLVHISSEGVHAVPCAPADEVNPLKPVKGWDAPPRQRREAELEAFSTDDLSFLPSKRKYKTLTCSDGLGCVQIRCPLLGLDSTARIVLHSRLWNTTLAEDYSSFNYLDIVVEASLSLSSSSENIGLKSKRPVTQVKLTVFFERKVKFLTKVAWWIIFLTVLSLLLCLAFIVCFLWKQGCVHGLAHKKKQSHFEDPKTELAPLKG